MIPNDDDDNPYYDILPRLGAFEVSTVVNDIDVLFYSKQMSIMWPHAGSLAKRIGEWNAERKNKPLAALKEQFQTSGRQIRAPRQGRRRSVDGTVAESALQSRKG